MRKRRTRSTAVRRGPLLKRSVKKRKPSTAARSASGKKQARRLGRKRIKQRNRLVSGVKRRVRKTRKPRTYSEGYNQAYNEGYNAGFAKGFEDGHQIAYEHQV